MENMQAERGMTTSTPADPRKTGTFTKEPKRLSDIPAPPFPIVKKALMIDMISEAIQAVGVPRKGASYQAIKKWIVAVKLPESNTFNGAFKRAILRGIENGVLIRPHHSINARGVTGYFTLSKKVNKPSEKALNKAPEKAAGKSTKKVGEKHMKKDPLKTLKKDPAKAPNKDPVKTLKKDSVKTLKKDTAKSLKKDPARSLMKVAEKSSKKFVTKIQTGKKRKKKHFTKETFKSSSQ